MELNILEAIAQPNVHQDLINWSDKVVNWSLTSGLKILFIIAIAWLLKIIAKRSIQRIVKTAVQHGHVNEEGEIKRMNTLVRIFSWTVSTIIVVIAAMMILQEFGVKIAPILASAGIVGVAIGFGGQYLVKDLITGFFIIFENQYRIGDVVNIEGIGGTVEDISLRVTTLRDMNGTVHYIPHGEVKKVSNSSKQFAKVNINVGIAYEANIDFVRDIINQIGNDLAADPAWKDMINVAPQFLRVDSLDDSSVSIKIVGETKPLKQWEVSGELRKRIKEGFEKAGISIPYPQQVVHHIGTTILPDTEI
ncbi:MAG TPA: mechanosensitive ion channel family protein [Bacteroidales bacterium]|nr:mechanosensitive ion channel family protein [Bacteroidales bacterium]